MNVRKTATAVALAAILGASSAHASITKDGITFTSGALFETIDIFEGELLGDGNGNDNKIIDLPGEELVGIGIINRIRDADNNILWEDGDNGRELTFVISGYIAEDFNLVTPSLGEILFSGGQVDLYSQVAGTFGGVVSNNQAADIASASSGNLWMTLVGSPIGGQENGNDITLRSVNIGNNPFTGVANVTGTGLLDVTGGPAGSHFDTNTKGCEAADGAPCPDDADISFTSSGQADPSSNSAWGFGGTGEVRAFAIPVPGTLALLGFGLAGLGMRANRKAKKA